MDGPDGEPLRPTGLTGARLIGIVLVLLVLLVVTLGLVEWINRGAGDVETVESDAGTEAPAGR